MVFQIYYIQKTIKISQNIL